MKGALFLFLPLCVGGEPALIAPETVVTASRLDDEESDTPQGTTKIKAEDLLENGAVTLPEILQREPGVSVPLDVAGVDTLVPYLQGGSKAINIRGMEGDRVEILVDGIRQPDDSTARSFEGAGGPGRIYFDPAVLSELDIFKSARPGSGALAGTIAGRTESPFSLLGPDLLGTTVNRTTSYASQNRSLNERLATAWGNGSLASSLVYSYRNGHELENKGSLSANPADHESHAFVWKGVLRNDSWIIEPTIDYFHSDSFTDLDSLETESLVGRTLKATNDSERERYRLSLDVTNRHSHPLADEISAKIYFQSARTENLNIQQTTFRNRTNTLNYQTDIAGLNLSAYKEIGDHLLSYEYLGAWSDIEGSLLRVDEGLPESDFPNLAPSIVWDHALSLSDRIFIGERWTITPAVRLHYYQVNPTNTEEFLEQSKLPVFDEFGRLIGERIIEAVDYENTFLAPSLHFEYQATDSLTLFGSYSRGYRNPTAEELSGVFVHPDNLSISLPNPGLEAEDSHNFEIGVKHRTSHWDTSFSTYFNRYGNFLESNVPTGEIIDGLEVLRTQNTQNVDIFGLELKTEWSNGSYCYGGAFSWAEGDSDDAPLNTIDPWKLVGWAGYNAPSEKWGVELAGTLVGAKRASQISGDIPPTDSYFLLDLTGYYHLNDNVTLRAGIKNILDEEYVLWSRSNRGSGHNGSATNSRDTQPGINGFLSVNIGL
ncbi:MAG: TonB-dependent receptor domain-containing protein [Akkermansiaceae bacterium]